MDRLPERLQKKIMPITESGCWIWMTTFSSNGYGNLSWKGKQQLAHRLIYKLLKGSIPEGMTLDHLCRVRCCVNPNHLEPVNMRTNILRGMSPNAKQARLNQCHHGHSLDYISPDGERGCRKCRYEAVKRWRKRKGQRMLPFTTK